MKLIEDLTDAPEWKKTLQEALQEARSGRGTYYANDKEFLKALKDDFAKPKGKTGRRSPSRPR